MKAVVLAGGGGTRLWPLSRRCLPKQFLRLKGDGSLFQSTLSRLLKFLSPEDIIVVTNREYEFIVKFEIKELSLSSSPHIALEPFGRGTAPAIALSMRFSLERLSLSPSEVLFVTPSDHFLEPEEELIEAVGLAKDWAEHGWIMTFGIKPSRPETGYGYIEALGDPHGPVCEVKRFIEKPNLSMASLFLKKGNYFWNSGMFVFRIDTMTSEMRRFAPDIGMLLDLTYEEMVARFNEMPEISIDYAVMEKTNRIRMIPLDLRWSDVGSYDAIYELLDKDEEGNVLKGDVLPFSSRNTMVMGDKRLIVILGVEDLLIVEAEDAVLVAKRGESQRVRDVVKRLRDLGRREADEGVTVYRPWGKYTVLEEGKSFKVKKVVLNPGERLTFQRHRHRSEHWIVVRGEAKISFEDREVIVREGESIFVPKLVFHRLENPGEVPLEIIEVGCGDYLGEDDIERL